MRPARQRPRRSFTVGLVVALAPALFACERAPDTPAPPASASAPGSGSEPGVPAGSRAVQRVLVDTALAPAVAGEEGWMYSREVEADLDADGQPERLVLTARVEMYRGRPAWDDGQPWQIYVEESDGQRTYLYARFVQLGTVEMRVGVAENGRPPSVVLLEHLPQRLALYEIVYQGPGDFTTTEHFQRTLDATGQVAAPTLP